MLKRLQMPAAANLDGHRMPIQRLVLLSIPLGIMLVVMLTGYLMLSAEKPVAPAMPETPNLSTSPLGVQAASTDTLYLPLTVKYYDPSYVSPFGISMFGALDDSTGLGKMRGAGARWAMTNLSWRDVQPTENGPYDWSAYDVQFANAAAAGMSLYVLFDDNPSWVTSARRGPVPDDKMPALKNVVQAMVERYTGTQAQPRIDYWSFYGEPDNITAWGNNGAQFAAMLSQVAPIIHSANPNAKVLIGGLAYDFFVGDELGGPQAFVRSFLTDTLQALNTNYGGAANYIDAVAFHFYPISLPRWPTIREKAQDIRGIMTRHGVGHLPLIVPEMSMWSNWSSGENQTLQAQYLVQFYVRGLSVGIRQLYWFQVFDIPDNPTTGGDDYSRTQGLFKESNLNDPKLSYFAYQILTRELDRARYANVLNVSGAEGYVFTLDGGSKTVVWGTSDTPTPIDFAQTCARRVTMLGTADTIADGGPGDPDGVANGQIRLAVTRNEPIYMGACP